MPARVRLFPDPVYSKPPHCALQGPTNQTILLANDTVIRDGFRDVAEMYTNLTDTASFADQLLELATTDVKLPGDDTCGHPDCDPSTNPLRLAALVVLKAFADSHTLKYIVNFYADQSVRSASLRPMNQAIGPAAVTDTACLPVMW